MTSCEGAPGRVCCECCSPLDSSLLPWFSSRNIEPWKHVAFISQPSNGEKGTAMIYPVISHRRTCSFERSSHLCHHSSPCNNVRFSLSPLLLLERGDGIHETIEMIIIGVVQLLKVVKAPVQICRQIWRVIVAKRRSIWTELMLCIVRKTSDLLRPSISMYS